MITQTLEQWYEEAEKRFGQNKKEWVFVCPSCGSQQKIQDFSEKGIDANSTHQECIGRHDASVDCNWAAYGLLGTLGKGRIVLSPNGNKTEVFDFGEPSLVHNEADE